MYIHIHVYTYTCIYKYIYIYMYIHIQIHIHTYIYVHVYRYRYICTYIYMISSAGSSSGLGCGEQRQCAGSRHAVHHCAGHVKHAPAPLHTQQTACEPRRATTALGRLQLLGSGFPVPPSGRRSAVDPKHNQQGPTGLPGPPPCSGPHGGRPAQSAETLGSRVGCTPSGAAQ